MTEYIISGTRNGNRFTAPVEIEPGDRQKYEDPEEPVGEETIAFRKFKDQLEDEDGFTEVNVDEA